MPNWVNNTLTVEGSMAQEFAKKAAQTYTLGYKDAKAREETYATPIYFEVNEKDLSFFNFVKPETEKAMEDYITGGWYDWNVYNWGTKWDALEVSRTDDRNNPVEVSFIFNTAWSPPVEWLYKVAEQYPDLKFTLEYREESGWGGEMIAYKGEVVADKSYDVPSSHQEWIDQGEECLSCVYEQELYEDCPKEEEVL